VIIAIFAAAWRTFEEISLVVIGQPSSTGALQGQKEVPFFETLPKRTRLPFRVSYRPSEKSGFKDTHQLQMLHDGVFDLASLRFPQNRQTEPLIPDFATARQVVSAYEPTLDRGLQRRFHVKLLGIWTFGPQELFSRTPLRGLADIAGRKVRVGDASLSPVISALGAIPVVIPFDDTRQALELGLVDCAVTSAASATYAGWTETAPHYLPIAVHFGLNGYVISLRKWDSLSRRQQAILKQAFDAHISDLWRYSEDLHAQALGGGHTLACSRDVPVDLRVVTPAPKDIELMRELALSTCLGRWMERCDAVHPGAVSAWREKIAPIIPLPLAAPRSFDPDVERHP
jgi:TRAP-type C4-dicarboxylate transport system substrate-binding protein